VLTTTLCVASVTQRPTTTSTRFSVVFVDALCTAQAVSRRVSHLITPPPGLLQKVYMPRRPPTTTFIRAHPHGTVPFATPSAMLRKAVSPALRQTLVIRKLRAPAVHGDLGRHHSTNSVAVAVRKYIARRSFTQLTQTPTTPKTPTSCLRLVPSWRMFGSSLKFCSGT